MKLISLLDRYFMLINNRKLKLTGDYMIKNDKCNCVLDDNDVEEICDIIIRDDRINNIYNKMDFCAVKLLSGCEEIKATQYTKLEKQYIKKMTNEFI